MSRTRARGMTRLVVYLLLVTIIFGVVVFALAGGTR